MSAAQDAPPSKSVSTTIAPPPKSYSKPPTSKPAPVSCAGGAKVIVPLYMRPGAAWDEVAAGARFVQTIAIINPNNGPAAELDSLYVTSMQKLHDAGVVMVGYIDTNYGNRELSSVKADIDTYAAEYPLLSGVFLDHAGALTTALPYYETLYTYVLSMPGWTYDILNPGIIPNSMFLSVSTQIVSLNDYGLSIASASVPSGFTCAQRDHYVAMIHNVNARVMQTTVDALLNKNYIGYIYLTDGTGQQHTQQLSSYYSAMVSYLATKGK